MAKWFESWRSEDLRIIPAYCFTDFQDKEYAAEDAKAWTLDLSNEIKASAAF